MAYPGGKGNCFQRIINMIPPHRVYIEPYLGGGSIMANKRPAGVNIGIDINPIVLSVTANEISPGGNVIFNGDRSLKRSIIANNDNGSRNPFTFICMDAVEFLSRFQFSGNEVVYCDPPYLMGTRKCQRDLYENEYSDQDHIRLLGVIRSLNCHVAISGYWSELYAEMLAGWNSISFTTQTRGGSPATEHLWMNYPEPNELHDYRYLGDNFRERERIKRKKARWVNRLKKLDKLERRAILWAIRESGMLLQDRHICR